MVSDFAGHSEELRSRLTVWVEFGLTLCGLCGNFLLEGSTRCRQRSGGSDPTEGKGRQQKRDDARACKVNCTPDLKQWFVKMDQVKDDQRRLRGRGSDACWWRARNARRWQFGGGAAPVAPNGSSLPKERRRLRFRGATALHSTLQRRSDLAASSQRQGTNLRNCV